MAPVCSSACRLLFVSYVFYVLVPFLLLFVQQASPLRVYEREFLLGLRKTAWAYRLLSL